MKDIPTDQKKRSFLTIATGTMVVGGVAAAVWPFVRQMSPGIDVERPLELEFLHLKEGEQQTFTWRGTPHVLRHRTSAEVESTRSVDVNSLKDRLSRNAGLTELALATVENRSFGPDGAFIVMVPVCTHRGCLLVADVRNMGGMDQPGTYFCPCHAATFDSLGRVYKGPANFNLPIPKFLIKKNRVLVIGTDV
jgi:ubiquinol-cytochrome c reductase iron-sulfur subunit